MKRKDWSTGRGGVGGGRGGLREKKGREGGEKRKWGGEGGRRMKGLGRIR